jgi:hypothetical protein
LKELIAKSRLLTISPQGAVFLFVFMEKNVPISGILKKEVEVFERSYYLWQQLLKVKSGVTIDER